MKYLIILLFTILAGCGGAPLEKALTLQEAEQRARACEKFGMAAKPMLDLLTKELTGVECVPK